MRAVDASTVDLELLPALEAILVEGSVTRAAQRLGIGQPAVSHALARLRRQLGDPILVRSGAAWVPTARAAAMRAPLLRALADVRAATRRPDASTLHAADRPLVLACPDLLAPLLPALSRRLERAAPRAPLHVVPLEERALAALEEGDVDVCLGARPHAAPRWIQRGLGEVTFAIAMRAGHPLAAKPRPTRAEFARFAHVQVRSGHGGDGFVATALRDAAVRRRVGLVVSSFLSALGAVAECDLLFSAPRELVAPLAARFQLVLRPIPIRVAPVRVCAMWHERLDQDPTSRGFRELVIEEATALLRPSS